MARPCTSPRAGNAEALELMKSFNADVCIGLRVLFVPQPVARCAASGTFQYHPSLLAYAPRAVLDQLAIAMARAARPHHLLAHEGLDEGPILIQKSVEIGPDETLGDVYFKKLFPMGVDAMIEGSARALQASCSSMPRTSPTAPTRAGSRRRRRSSIGPSPRHRSTTRSAPPTRAGAWAPSRGEGRLLRQRQGGRQRQTGESRPSRPTAWTIAAGGGAILASAVRGADGKKIAAADWAKATGVGPGDVFDKPAPKPQA